MRKAQPAGKLRADDIWLALVTTMFSDLTSPSSQYIFHQETSATNGTYTCEDELYYGRIEGIITLYGFGAVLCFGVIGNLVSLVVLQHNEFRLTSMRFTLSALAIVDTGLLVFGLLRQWLWEIMARDPRSQTRFLCKSMHFGVYFFGQLSPWTIVLLTLERLVSIYRPLKAKTMCSTRRVVAAWLVLTALLFAINAHLLWRADLRDITYTYYGDEAHEYERCEPGQTTKNGTVVSERRCLTCDSWDTLTNLAWMWIDLVLVCFLPSVIIFVGNAAIIIKLCRVELERRGMQSTSGAGHCNANPHCSTNVMLVSNSVWFLVTTSPLQFFLLFAIPDGSAFTDLNLAICNALYYLNSSTNFVLYCLTGSIFRKAFVATFRRTGSTTSLRHNSASSAHASLRIRPEVNSALLCGRVALHMHVPLEVLAARAMSPCSSLVSLPLQDKGSIDT